MTTASRPAPTRAGPRSSYLIGGMAVWGFVGWLVDRWLDTGGIATAIGVVLGAAGGDLPGRPPARRLT